MMRIYMAWNNAKIQVDNDTPIKTASILIAARNESKNIAKLLECLLNQNYNKNLFEVIIIDDHSEDNSETIIRDFSNAHPSLNIKYFLLGKDKKGKKAALQMAYQIANNDIIITTDADIEMTSDWIHHTVNAFSNHTIMMTLGGVKIKNPNSFIERFQALELLSLIGSGAGTAFMNNTIMSNGANMAFRKEVLDKIDHQKLMPQKASGDDIFFLMEVKKIYGPKAITFIKHPDHFVSTKAVNNVKKLLQQRIRWVSKSGQYTDKFLLLTSAIVLLQNLLLPVLLILSLFVPTLIQTLLFISILKISFDSFFLNSMTKFINEKNLMRSYFIMAYIYPIFISYTAIYGQFASFNWKGRNY